MPISTNYVSTGRPPGKYLRQSLKEFFSIILEFLQPPFHIFSIDNNNNNYHIICYDNGGNGGTQTTINHNITSTYDDNKEADKDTAHSIHRTNGSICY
jgi:hypothetical protein